jgi:RimJ/RimL family protein N-acetyltransferase
MQLQTPDLTLVLRTPEQVRADIAALPADQRAYVSSEWLALLESTAEASLWVHGFTVRRTADDAIVGQCGFTGPPQDGVAEIAYAVEPAHQGRGYATQVAAALTTCAFETGSIVTLVAHTLPETNASTRVLEKCGFQNVGTFEHPTDGPVWRWERRRSC